MIFELIILWAWMFWYRRLLLDSHLKDYWMPRDGTVLLTSGILCRRFGALMRTTCYHINDGPAVCLVRLAGIFLELKQ